MSAKKYITNLLSSGHKHTEMSQQAKCSSCGGRFKKAQKEFNRLYKENPKDFARKEYEFDRETENIGDKLTERIKYDPLYQKHLQKLASGLEKMKSGFYKKHSNYGQRKIFV